MFPLVSDPSDVSRLTQLFTFRMMTPYKAESIPLKAQGGLCFSLLCGTTAPDLCAFEHAELNCASCSNSVTPVSTQVPHWSHTPLDGVIQPALHFIVYTPRNGDICKKANKNIPSARNAPGISSPTPGYDSLSALVCFHRTTLFQGVDIDPVLVNGVVFSKWMTLKTRGGRSLTPFQLNLFVTGFSGKCGEMNGSTHWA